MEAGIDLTNDKTFVYVNGVLTNPGGTSASGTFNDWAGTDGNSGDGIGVKAGSSFGASVGGDLDACGRFDGQIAVVRLYDSLLTDAQVADNYNAAVPEPGTAMLLLFGAGWVIRRKRTATTA